ncbi:hypothetical protein PHLCEN_2v5779 [Hermanssonia centrifuga]|uniref:Uncharacterized protein n=1 Tax=Hermanssonia centrifuga TaxID=98765 RepID=A0A2R6P1G7_9APHY|nr:hypothetical protein PHLCEN_2v5779 [Hermanssonia centrifuga]
MHSVLLAMNIAQVALKAVNPSLTPILISRFLLNLRQLGEPENETQSRFNFRFSIPGFRVPTLESIVGNMGADLDHGPAGEVDDDEAEEADVNGGDAGVAVLDAIAAAGSGGACHGESL